MMRTAVTERSASRVPGCRPDPHGPGRQDERHGTRPAERSRVASRVRVAANLTGRVLVGAGVVVLLFVAYELWGTRWQEARAQERLRRSFEAAAVTVPTAEPSPPHAGVGPAATTSTTTTTTTLPPPPALGEPVAVLRIPRIGLDKVVVEGVGTDELKQGPGHYGTTPLPGYSGNAAIAGHRTTYGAPFFRLNELQPGDEILVTTLGRDLRYVVTGQSVVSPDDIGVLAAMGDNRLTLTTCEPRYSARSRLIVTAVLDGLPLDASAPVALSSAPVHRPTRVDLLDPVSTPRAAVAAAVDDTAASALSFSVVWPGLVTALLAWSIWRLARRTRRWWLLVPGIVPVAVGMVFFFERLAAVIPTEA